MFVPAYIFLAGERSGAGLDHFTFVIPTSRCQTCFPKSEATNGCPARSKIWIAMADLFTPAEPPAQERNWMPIVIGLIAVLLVVGIIVVLTRSHGPTASQTNPYADKLHLSTPKLSAAENYVGGTVTYLDVNITNTGDRALVGADMKAVFKNTLDEVVQTETLPLRVLGRKPDGRISRPGGLGPFANCSRTDQDGPCHPRAHLGRLEPQLP